MKQFLKYVLATVVGILATGLFASLLSLLMVFSIALADSGKPTVQDGSVLRISLSGMVKERAADNPFASILGNDNVKEQGLDDLLLAIKEAKTNPAIRGIYLEGGVLSTDYATLQELRRQLVDFKKSGKFIVAYADMYTQGTYYLASVADKVIANPDGMIDWHGIAAQPIFFTDLLKKVGVKMQVFKVGTFKSAVEPFILTQMSEPNRLQVKAYIGDIWNNVCKEVAQSRRISVEQLNHIADNYSMLADQKSYVQNHLADTLSYADGVRDVLRRLSGQEKVNFVEPAELAKLYEQESGDGQIAVYYAEGDIVDQAAATSALGNTSQIVGSKVVEDLDRLANDDDVKAVVLRINSGGGSAYASEQMWRAVQLLKQKKPVVVSMSGMAASGGYYLSCGADYIVAEPTTLTGSIGIFGMIPDATGLLTEKLGLHFDIVKTNQASDFGAQGRPFSAAEAEAMQGYVNRGYHLFLKRVAAGRHMTTEQVDKIAQGRVWTGNQALGIKLVDKLGSLDDAIAIAAQRAKVKTYSVASFPDKASWMDNLLASTVKRDYMEEKMRAALGEYYAPIQFVSTLRGLDGRSSLQARPFYMINLK